MSLDSSMTSFWRQPAAAVSGDARDAEIRRELRCDFTGLTRTQVARRLGAWTSVTEYPRTSNAHGGLYFVWSNGSNTPGIGITFRSTHGPATSAERYAP